MQTERGVTVPMDNVEVDRHIKLIIKGKERLFGKKNESSNKEVSFS